MPKNDYENGGDSPWHPEASPALGYLGAKGEVMRGIIVPEIDEQLQATYVQRPEGLLLCGCGDDRTCTHASSQLIEDKYDVAAKGPILRYYGGLAGATRMMMVTLAAQHGEDALKEFKKRGFMETAKEFSERARQNANVIFALHSATGSEKNDREFRFDASDPVGCAYAASLGAVSTGAFSPENIHLTLAEAPSIFKVRNLEGRVGSIAGANRLFVNEILGGRSNFGVSRIEFRRSKAPIMLLDRDHANASNTLAVNNFKRDKISDPDAAHQIGRPFYNNDMTQVAEAIIKSYPEYDFDPFTLLLNMDMDIRSTRGALAGGDPTGLELQTYGSAQEAIDYLSGL